MGWLLSFLNKFLDVHFPSFKGTVLTGRLNGRFGHFAEASQGWLSNEPVYRIG